MSRNFTVLEKAALDKALSSAAAPALSEPGIYAELIRRVFRGPSAVAIVGSGISLGAVNVCDEIAAELAASGKRVVVVLVDKLLRINPLPVPDETAFLSGSAPNIWRWPVSIGQKIEFFKSRELPGAGNWLDSLRRNFDSVLLDCPAVQTTSGVTEVAAMADATVLVVEAYRSQRQIIQFDQRALQLGGARLVGCVLIGRTKNDAK